jgi:hypothetical protein
VVAGLLSWSAQPAAGWAASGTALGPMHDDDDQGAETPGARGVVSRTCRARRGTVDLGGATAASRSIGERSRSLGKRRSSEASRRRADRAATVNDRHQFRSAVKSALPAWPETASAADGLSDQIGGLLPHVSGIRRAVRETRLLQLIDGEPALSQGTRQAEWLRLHDLERALAKLPEEQRSVVLLVGLEGNRYQTAASLLDLPIGTVRSRLFRGRKALRQLTDGAASKAAAGAPLAGGCAARQKDAGRHQIGKPPRLGDDSKTKGNLPGERPKSARTRRSSDGRLPRHSRNTGCGAALDAPGAPGDICGMSGSARILVATTTIPLGGMPGGRAR